MKYLIIIFCIFSYTSGTFGQTYIGPIVGYDFAQIQSNSEKREYWDYHTYNIGFSFKSPVFGIKLEQYIFQGLLLSFQSTYTHKTVPGSGFGIIPIYGFFYNCFQQNLSIKYLIAQKISIGGGIDYNFYNGISWDHGTRLNKLIGTIDLKYQNKGFHFCVGTKVSDFDFELYYYKSPSYINVYIIEGYHLDPISSIGVKLSYDFKLFDPLKLFNKKAMDCPKF